MIDPTVEIWEVNKSVSFPPPYGMAEHDRERARIEALPPAERDRALLGLRPTPESLCGDWWKGAALPQDIALQKSPPDCGNLSPVRDGRCDILLARGAVDARLRMPLAFAGLDTFRVHEALLVGGVRQGPWIGLHEGVGWREYPRFDLVVCTGIPHAAIGAENAYGLAAWVKAGGGLLFTGGEYAFGKGGYMHTVLERELLPLTCTEMVDTAYADPPGTIGPGPDLSALGVAVDFSAKPAYWVRNRVVPKEGVKVFLESQGRPILIGWQVGRGRVACLMVDHRGRSTGDVTAFFDWQDWPRLVTGLLQWLAPDAGKVVARPAVAAKADDPADDLDDVLGGGAGAEEPVVAAPLGEAGERSRARDRFIEIAAHAAADKIGEGRRRLAELAALEQKTETDFRRQCGDDAALVANYPCLDSDAVLERMAWLTYCARHETAFCGDFLREWIRTDLYRDYCDRSADNAVDEKKIKATGAVAAARRADWSDLSARFAALRDAARPQAEAVLQKHPVEAAAALARSRFVPEIRAAINLLGGIGRDAGRPVLDALAAAPAAVPASGAAADLAAFAAARLRTP